LPEFEAVVAFYSKILLRLSAQVDCDALVFDLIRLLGHLISFSFSQVVPELTVIE